MAKKFLSAIQLLTVNADPASASAGDLYFNTTSSLIKYYDGTLWSVVPKNLGDLNDISASGVTNGQTLVYNGTLSKWENDSAPPSIVPSGEELPESSTNGSFFYNTSDEQLYFYFNQWSVVGSGEEFNIDNGYSSTVSFSSTLDCGNSSTVSFSPIYSGGDSNG